MLSAMVTKLGHECLVAQDGDEAWGLHQLHAPDVLVTDRMMPGLDGIELCRRIRDGGGERYTYIVLITTLSGRPDVMEGIRAGADDYLVKPLDPFELEVRLTSAERVTALHARLRESAALLAATARTDALTGIGNRRRFDEDLADIHARAKRRSRPYSLAVVDVDHFKAYNDHYGHLAGDEVLGSVAGAMVRSCRLGDEIYRFGGEEFVIVFVEEQLPEILAATERVRRAIELLAVSHQAQPVRQVVTVSIGVAQFDPLVHTDSDQVLKEADEALYRAKAGGRNRVMSKGQTG
jgi:two-component system chemotaxis response regulator CheY